MKKQLAELAAMVKRKSAGPGDGSRKAVPSAADEPQTGEARTVRSKAWHVCASPDHMKAECPYCLEVRKLEAWVKVLRGDGCPLSTTIRDA